MAPHQHAPSAAVSNPPHPGAQPRGHISVDVWMCGCVDEWMCGCVDVWMSGCVDGSRALSRTLGPQPRPPAWSLRPITMLPPQPHGLASFLLPLLCTSRLSIPGASPLPPLLLPCCSSCAPLHVLCCPLSAGHGTHHTVPLCRGDLFHWPRRRPRPPMHCHDGSSGRRRDGRDARRMCRLGGRPRAVC